ncbi:MAG TPA: O-antigen ligase family protein [Candidatus Binatia bacterium]|nr:O-antigen ligase family protein [Candidatus Binatia bacterium]
MRTGLRFLQFLTASPSTLFLAALAAMLLRHPDVPFYEIDRVAFGVLVLGLAARAVVLHHSLLIFERVTLPMLALTLLAVTSVLIHPFDNQAWCLLAAKYIVPFSLFHLAQLVFDNERSLRHLETFCLVVLAYLCFTSIAFLVGAKPLIFPRFILDESLGYHADRARGPLLQAVANGVSLNILGVLALHAFLRGKIRGLRATLLLGALPLAVLATMTRAVWLSSAGSVGVLIFHSGNRNLRRICAMVATAGIFAVLITLSFGDQRRAVGDRFEESGPVEFRQAVYTGGWQMFLEKPLTGWGVNQMPSELARHVSGFRHRELYPHNTYLELLVEHGLIGLALYLWILWEILLLGRTTVPPAERHGFLDQQFHTLWPVILGIFVVNASLVVMNYQFVNGLLFTMAGMLAAQRRRSKQSVKRRATPSALTLAPTS